MPDLTPLLSPRSIAVIGASSNKEIIRGRLLHVLLARGFQGKVFPVTPSHAEVQGLRAYRSIAEVPGPVDLAIVVIPAAAVLPTLEQCGACGVKAALVITSGFAEERGEVGRARQEEIRAIAARHGMVICGPNSEGLVNVPRALAATFSPAVENPEISLAPDVEGGRTIGVTAQSGALAFAYLNRGRPRQLRFSYLVSTGNEANLEGLDYIDHMLDEGATDIFLMYVEAIKSGDRFRAVADRAAAQGKPLIVAKVGRSEAARRAAASHTGSLAGSDSAYDAMFRHHGVIRCHDIDDMLDVAAGFAFCPLPRGRRIALLSASGGSAVWMADILQASGLEVPELDSATRKEIDALIPSFGSSQNPVDLTAQAIREVGYARVIDILRRSPLVDAVVVIGSLATETVLRRDIDALRQVAAASEAPVMFCAYTLASPGAITLLAGAGIPAYTTMSGCAQALRALADYAEFQARWKRRERPAQPPAPVPAATQQLHAAGDVLTEYEAKSVLATYGVPRLREEMAESEEAAVAAAGRVGYPVALKVQSPDITHKTEAGAVALRLDSDAAVREAYRRIVASARAAHPGAALRGVLVQRMAARGHEVIVGVTRDPSFGPMLMVGLGGIHVEVLRDVAFAPVPLSREDARALLGQLRGAKLLEGVRGEPPADVEALLDVLVGVSRFAAAHAGAIEEADLNPVIVHPAGQGVSVVDALLVKRREP